MVTMRPDRKRPGDALHALLIEPSRPPFPNLVDDLYDYLWKRIVNLEFPPGARLSDMTLAKDLGVSRTPIREALYRLAQDGLVRMSARRGFFVATLDRREAAEILDLRTALEVLATRLATPLLTAEETAVHVEAQQRARAHGTSTDPAHIEEYFHANLLLHDLLLQRAGNRRMLQILANLKAQLIMFKLHIARVPTRRLQAIVEHEHLLAALATRDAAAAAAAMHVHLQGVKERILEDFFSAGDHLAADGTAHMLDGEGEHERSMSARGLTTADSA